MVALHGLETAIEIVLHLVEIDGYERTVYIGRTIISQHLTCPLDITVEGQFGHIEQLIITMAEAWFILIAQLLISLKGAIEVALVAIHEVDISRHGQRERAVLGIIGVDGNAHGFLQPIQRLTTILQTEHLCQTVVSTHGELRVIIAHLLQSLRKVLLGLDAVVTGGIDIAQQSCSEIIELAGPIVTQLTIEALGNLHRTEDHVVAQGEESLVVQQLIIKHHEPLISQMLLIIASERIELIRGTILEEMAEAVELYPILSYQVFRTHISRENCRRYHQQYDGQNDLQIMMNKPIHKLLWVQK